MITADGRLLMGAAIIGFVPLFCDIVNCFMSPSGLPAYRSRVAIQPLSWHPHSRPSRHSEALMEESGPLLHRIADGKGPIVENELLPEKSMMDRGRALGQAWRAALQVCTIGEAAAGAARPSRAGIVEFLLPGQNESTATSVDVGDFDKEISFDDFERSLLKGEVKRCEFFGSNFEKAVLQLADGSKALIGEGYPQDRAFSNDSPLKVVGMLRNAGVPFTTPFKTNKYAKPRLYKTAETLQAENRQRTEDASLDRLMSE